MSKKVGKNKYWERWSERPDRVDCFICRGDEAAHTDKDPVPCAECAFTGLDPMPWSEIMTCGRTATSWRE